MKKNVNTNQYSPNWLKTRPQYFIDTILDMINENPQACNSDVIPDGFGRFGLDETNPIPIYGIPENDDYLSRLRLGNETKLRWKRVGSITTDNINNPIDKYKIFIQNGKTITYLYLSPYHLKTSTKAPDGFKILV